MNRNDRSRIMMRTRDFMTEIISACSAYSVFLESSFSAEEEKLSNIPDAFSNSDIYENISIWCENISAAIESVQEIESAVNEIPDILDIQIRKPRLKTVCHVIPARRTVETLIPYTYEKRTERLQLVLTPSMMTLLKTKAAETQLSINELVNRLLSSDL